MKIKLFLNRILASMGKKRVIILISIIVIVVIAITGNLFYIKFNEHNINATKTLGDPSSSAISVPVNVSSSSVSETSSISTPASSRIPAVQVVTVQTVSLNQTSITLTVGQTVQLAATVDPENTTDKSITWSSSDKYTASVSNGLVKAEQSGTAYIYAKTSNKAVF